MAGDSRVHAVQLADAAVRPLAAGTLFLHRHADGDLRPLHRRPVGHPAGRRAVIRPLWPQADAATRTARRTDGLPTVRRSAIGAGIGRCPPADGHRRGRHRLAWRRSATWAALLASVSMVFGAGLGPLFAGGLAQTMAHPILPVFGTELAVLGSALVVACVLPLRRPVRSSGQPLRLRLPTVPAANRRHLAYGIATFGPGITATSFMLALGPSLLSRLLDVRSPMIAGGMACAMFLTATGVQFSVRNWPIRWIFLGSATSTVLAMACIGAAVYTSLAPILVAAALLAGAGQGLGQLGGLTLIGLHVPDARRAEANAVLNIGGYIPAGLMPVAAGYLIDRLGAASGTTVFCVLLALAAAIGGGFVMSFLVPGKIDRDNLN